ncbi:MAG: GMC family oxidoreductase, partial [Pseudomonadota bacterium]|nr:GMC family oxidoreductase [Pseudomonadota bacterium]
MTQHRYVNESAEVYDAIVVGSGITGGWAAKELCEKGLKTLMVERGRVVEHRKDYTTEAKPPWEYPNRMKVAKKLIDEE